MRTPKFVVDQDKRGEWRWRLKGANGEIVGSGEGYRTRAGALRGVKACRRAAAYAVLIVTD